MYVVRATNRLVFPSRRLEALTFQEFELARDLAAEPGQFIDLGTFDVTQGKRVRPRRPRPVLPTCRSTPRHSLEPERAPRLPDQIDLISSGLTPTESVTRPQSSGGRLLKLRPDQVLLLF